MKPDFGSWQTPDISRSHLYRDTIAWTPPTAIYREYTVFHSIPLLQGVCGLMKFTHKHLWIVRLLHDRLWISPWIKSISNELNIIIHVITSQLSGHCDVISNQLWCHQQNKNRASETRGQCVIILIVIYGFATREIKTKIPLSWVLKQFITLVHTLFSICFKSAFMCSAWELTLNVANHLAMCSTWSTWSIK